MTIPSFSQVIYSVPPRNPGILARKADDFVIYTGEVRMFRLFPVNYILNPDGWKAVCTDNVHNGLILPRFYIFIIKYLKATGGSGRPATRMM